MKGIDSTARIIGTWLLAISGFSWHLGAQAAELSLAQAPLFLGTTIEPNVFFELDDSGSMDWETLTFDYWYFTNYWASTSAGKIVSGVWENHTDGSTSGGKGSGGGGYGGSDTSKEFLYLFSNNDRLYTNTSYYATPEAEDQAYDRDWRGRSVDFNLLYYNPEVTYTPWVSSLPDASFTNARSNPISNQTGYSDTRSLDKQAFAVWTDDHGFAGPSVNQGPDDITDGANGVVDLWDTYTLYTFDGTQLKWTRYNVPAANTVKALNKNCTLAHALATIPYSACLGVTTTTGSYSSTAINPWGRNLTQEKQNFANWYQYYRKRSFVAKGAIARVVTVSDNFRYGLSLINSWSGYSGVFVQVPAGDATTFPTHNASLLEDMFEYRWSGQGTPLRQGLYRTGQYFDATLSGKTDPIISECQQNFSILISDGFWSGDASDVASAVGNADGDSYNRTLADVAKYFYDKDLSSLPNDVPTSVIDGNNKQHMVTFTVAFGLRGALVDTDNDGYPNPVLEEDDNWGNVYSTSEGTKNDARIDDLWHAAFNSKGHYIQAQAPDDLVNALNDALSEITDRVGSSASVATNSGSLNAGSHLFQARFDSGGWSGQLIAFAINADATLNPTPSWEAGAVLDTQHYSSGRSILTMNSSTGTGIPFRFPANYQSPIAASEMSSSQVNLLLKFAPYAASTANSTEIAANQSYGQDILNYLRGDRSKEETAPRNFRGRNSALGDIVDSDPKYVGAPRSRYPTGSFAPKAYTDFAAGYATRAPMVYVGANDGMLHGFRESDGRELLAYVPSVTFSGLADLSDDEYDHRYFVNEAPTIVDAYLPSRTDPLTSTTGAWRSVLVGGLGAGGQGVYALDVTNPATFSEANASSVVLWEFDHTDDADLGYTYSEIQIAKMNNGKWAAVFGNGYNNTAADGYVSSTGRAALFIVDLDTGALIKKISTGSGSVGTPNGLATPSLIDTDGDGDVDLIYAGDLVGQVWKFDVGSNTVSNWKVDYNLLGVPQPLFTTIGNQPITSPVQVAYHPEGRDGFMLYFGTGKYIEPGDNSVYAQPDQAFYGIWDKDLSSLSVFTSSNLLQQKILNQYAVAYDTDGDSVNDSFRTVRENSNYGINYDTHMGWYIKLEPEKVEGSANSSNFGEKQVSRSLVRDGRVIFTTVLPSQGACDFGGSSFTMTLDFKNGGQPNYPAFDLNGDGNFDDSDLVVGGLQSDVGIVPTLSILTDNDRDIAFGSGSSGDVQVLELNVGAQSLGRQSWRELK